MSETIVRYCIRCGSPTELRLLFGAQRPTCPACGWIYFSDPKVAAAMLVVRDGEVLLTRRANPPFQGMWGLPAGFIDAHEDPAQAAERECREETGLDVAATGLVDVVPGREHEKGADFVIVYRGEVRNGPAGEASLQAGDDADAAAFFPLDRLPPIAFRASRIVLGVDHDPD